MPDDRKYPNSGEDVCEGLPGEDDRFHPVKTLPCHIYEELTAFAEELEKKADQKIGELEKRVETLQQKLEEVQREKADLELMFEMSTEHSDGITDELLKNKPDKLMIRFSVTDPEFYDACLRARTIVD